MEPKYNSSLEGGGWRKCNGILTKIFRPDSVSGGKVRAHRNFLYHPLGSVVISETLKDIVRLLSAWEEMKSHWGFPL